MGTLHSQKDFKKSVLQRTVQGKRSRGRQKKSWADNILKWTGKSFAVTQAPG